MKAGELKEARQKKEEELHEKANSSLSLLGKELGVLDNRFFSSGYQTFCFL